jgi:hypothetical protein
VGVSSGGGGSGDAELSRAQSAFFTKYGINVAASTEATSAAGLEEATTIAATPPPSPSVTAIEAIVGGGGGGKGGRGAEETTAVTRLFPLVRLMARAKRLVAHLRERFVVDPSSDAHSGWLAVVSAAFVYNLLVRSFTFIIKIVHQACQPDSRLAKYFILVSKTRKIGFLFRVLPKP